MHDILNAGFHHLNTGDLVKARDAFQMVLNFDANDVNALGGMAAILHAEGEQTRAASNLKKATRFGASNPEALYNIGVIYSMIGDHLGAKKCLVKASQLDKNNPQVLMTLATTYEALGEFSLAIKQLSRSLELSPDSLDLNLQLGNLYFQTGHFGKALEHFQKEIERNASNEEAFISLSATYFKIGNTEAAINACKQALAHNPNNASVHYNLAKYYGLRKDLAAALDHSKRAFELAPSESDAAASFYQFRRQACDWNNIEILSTQLDQFLSNETQEPTNEIPFINIFRTANSATNLQVASVRSEKLAAGINNGHFAKRIERRRQKIAVLHEYKPIRIGYLSSDFRDHPTGHLMQNFFGLHDLDRFEVHAYSHGPDDGSPFQQTIQRECDSFTNIKALDDFEIAKKIAADNIDILIDLNVHITGERMGICAHRPAPIQISMLAYPGTSGASFYDFIITDQVVTPPDDEQFFSEKFIVMPDTYFVTNKSAEIANKMPNRSEFGLPNALKDGAAFACFNNSYKIEPYVFDCWLNILSNLPKSVLWLFANNDLCQTNLRKIANEKGIDETRLIFAEDLPKPEHLARLALADLALDTGIYGGHTTTADALLVGVPTITLAGDHFASRASSSILQAHGVAELICANIEAYEKMAIDLISNESKLANLKSKIKTNINSEPLFDGELYMENFEERLDIAFKMWVENQQFEHIT